MVGFRFLANSGKEYTTVTKIGSGGFGSVYLANDNLGSPVALKLINPTNDRKAVASFVREIESTSGLSHLNIVRVLDWGTPDIDGQQHPFIVTEFCPDGDYRGVINSCDRKGSTLEEILSDFRQILSGLAVLHSKIIHRDIKPENVLRAGSVLKIGDYGLAKFVDETTRTLTFKGYGSHDYMAPEVWLGQPVTAATDLYALGVMLFEALTGQTPFNEDDPSRLRDLHIYTPAPHVKLLKADVLDYLDGIVKKLLAKPASDRYQSSGEVLVALSRLEDSKAPPAALKIAELARRYEDEVEARSLEQMKQQNAAAEDKKRNLLARQNLISHFDNLIIEINVRLPATKIVPFGQPIDGKAYEYGPRILAIRFFDRGSVFRNINPNLADILRGKYLADVGMIQIMEKNGNPREGWNVVHVRPPDQEYGNWLLIETRTSPMARVSRKRIEPFATDDGLLGENLAHHWNKAMHIYNLKETPLSGGDIYRILERFMPSTP